MSDELKPCPFCAGLSQRDSSLAGEGIDDLASCGNSSCPCNEIYFTNEQWERRPTEDYYRSKLSIAVEALERVEDSHVWSATHDIAKDALAKIRST